MNEAKNTRNQTVTRVYPQVFITASLGGLSFLAFSNGLLLAYFSRLEISSSEILLLLALPSILQFMLVLVFSYLSDRVGKKLIGATGLFCSASAFYLYFAGRFQRRTLETQFFSGGSGFFRDRDGHVVQQLVCPAPSFDPSTDPGKVFRQAQIDLAGIWFSFFSSCILSPRTEPRLRCL